MSRYLTLFLLALLIVAFAVSARSQDTSESSVGKSNVQVLMRDKLTHMQQVLDGLVTDDFEKIANEAELLHITGKAASWQVFETATYKTHSDRYALLTNKLVAAAKEKNRDAALLDYLQLNISCIDCHQYMRNQHGATVPDLDILGR